MAAPPLAELRESEATGAIAEIYADIRHAVGVPMVNLIFRHMATVPGCLEWAWTQLAPLYAGGRIAEAANRVVAAPGARLTLAIDRAALAGHGVTADVAGDVVRTCRAYAHANPMNLLGLKVLHLLLLETPVARSRRKPMRGTQTRPAAVPLAALPPMADLAALPPAVTERLQALARQLHQGDNGVVPSLYRHFTAWPGVLDLLYEAVGAAQASGLLAAAAEAIERQAHGAARLLYLDCPVVRLPPPDADVTATLNGILATFPPNICRMTAVADAMVLALDGVAAEGQSSGG